jgi:bis(5'-nucleosyl)-tetraphosphatase (symmetrical)
MQNMALYLIGDVQGCNTALGSLLDRLDFSPSRDTVFLLGDLVNRGPDSAGVLRRLIGLGASARCILGNHDLHLLALAHGARRPSRKDTLACVLEATDRGALIDWLRHQRMALLERIGSADLLMVHAGVLPFWTASQTMKFASEVEAILQSPQLVEFLGVMYGNAPEAWSMELTGYARIRVIVNVLTRLRFCTANGDMEFETTDGAASAPAGYMPWFDTPDRKTANTPIAFGHWSTLGWLGRTDVFSMDTGCVWGGCLSALRVDPVANSSTWTTELIQVPCAQSQKPGEKG